MAHLSPCRGICQKDEETGWCIGCGRSTKEIVEWRSYDDSKRRQLMRTELKDRLRKLGRWPMRPDDGKAKP